jgi:hypothetical protein
MQYMLLIYRNAEVQLSPPEESRMMQEYMAFTQDIVKAGKFKAGDRLASANGATTVRVRDGKIVTMDGPFAETREQLGGFYIVDAKDADEAIAIAARIPGARSGSVEVREIVSPPATA